jgi:hypothetical protein
MLRTLVRHNRIIPFLCRATCCLVHALRTRFLHLTARDDWRSVATVVLRGLHRTGKEYSAAYLNNPEN